MHSSFLYNWPSLLQSLIQWTTVSSVQVDKPEPGGGFSLPLISMWSHVSTLPSPLCSVQLSQLTSLGWQGAAKSFQRGHLNLRVFSVCQPSHHHHSKLDETEIQSLPWCPKLTAQKARLWFHGVSKALSYTSAWKRTFSRQTPFCFSVCRE